MAAQTQAQPKRHHFVPKFYLRHFADNKRRVRMYTRGHKRKPIIVSVSNAAVESGLYTVLEESGDESQKVEGLLSLIEGQAKSAIDRILKGRFPPDLEDRSALALFMALQMLRTPEQHRQYEAMVDYTQKVLLEGWTPEYARERLEQASMEPTHEAVAQIMDVVENPDKYRFVPHKNEQIRIMLSVATNIAPVIAARSWLLGQCKTASFITSDHPVVWWSEPTEMSRYVGTGVGNAQEVHFPLDRHHALMLALPGSLPELVMAAAADNVLFVNWLVAEYSYRWIYQHPDDEPLDFLIPKMPKPLMEINGKPVFDR
ncbi:MAG: DUF4238 domain-containing protein [Chloroflexi bacterium]|nr:DUF4238 domain-containing protein [Chloroflexota bacterium]